MQIMNGYVIDGEQSRTNEFLRELCCKMGEPVPTSSKIEDVSNTINKLLLIIGNPDITDIEMSVMKDLLEDQKEQMSFHLGLRTQ